MKKHVGWDGDRPTRPRNYGGSTPGAVSWQYNTSTADPTTHSESAGWQSYPPETCKVIEDAYQSYLRLA